MIDRDVGPPNIEPVAEQRALSVIKKISSKTLFANAQLIEIQHGVDVYQLRLTKTGKLILTK